MIDIQKQYKGIILAAVLGIAAHFLSAYTPSFLNGILLAFLFGMLLGNFVSIDASFQSGIGFTSSKLLELSILFLAFSINYHHIAVLGFNSFLIVLIVVFSILMFTFFLAKKVKCPGSIGWLVGFGTAICGSSAIAALAPSVSKDKEDVGIAMAVVNLFGSVGMVIMPLILMELSLDSTQAGLIVGGTLHSVGNVAGAAYAMNSDVGVAAITIKLARVALLSPGLIFFNFLVNRHNVSHWKEHFNLPWYLWMFILITIASSVIQFPPEFLKMMETIGKIVLTIAMAAIGLKVSFKSLVQSGKRGIIFGLIVFTAQIPLVVGLLFIL